MENVDAVAFVPFSAEGPVKTDFVEVDLGGLVIGDYVGCFGTLEQLVVGNGVAKFTVLVQIFGHRLPNII